MGATRRIFWTATLATLSITTLECSQAVDCPQLVINFVGAAPGHQNDPCIAKVSATRSESFDVPACDGGCAEAGVKLDCPDPSNASLSLTECSRAGDALEIFAEGRNRDAIFDDVGSTNVTITLSCGGIELPDAGQGGSIEGACAK